MLNYDGSYSLSKGDVIVTTVIESCDQKQDKEEEVSPPSLPHLSLSLNKDRTGTEAELEPRGLASPAQGWYLPDWAWLFPSINN